MKDAKGHGSNKRIEKTSTTHYADNGQTFHRVHWSDKSVTESPSMGTHMQALFDRARREGAPHETSGNPHDTVTNNGGGYYARASASGGRKLGEYGPHTDREAAAADAWAKHPTARQVSTSRGPYGMDTQWHNSPDGKRGRPRFL